MTVLNEKVEHIVFGSGVITEVNDHMIRVQFQDEVETKAFLYPEAFKNFLKASNPTVESVVLEELRIKEEQIELKIKEKEREVAELIEKKAKYQVANKKSAVKTSKKKIKAS